MSADEARHAEFDAAADALHMALRSTGVPHSGSVTVAITNLIEALIDAKRAEELDRQGGEVAAAWALERWDAWAMSTLGKSGDIQEHGRVNLRGDISALVLSQLQPHGNEDAQTPGIDEGSDSEAVTADPLSLLLTWPDGRCVLLTRTRQGEYECGHHLDDVDPTEACADPVTYFADSFWRGAVKCEARP